MRLSYRVKTLKPSPTLAVNARAQQLRAEGIAVIDLSVGEPDFDTPEPIKEAARKALAEGFTKYTPTVGIKPLRERICRKLYEENGLSYTPEQILVSTGAKQCLYNFFTALLSPGDEVLIPAPYWVSYTAQVEIAGGRSVLLPTRAEDGFQLDPATVKAAITPYTRAIVLNSPNNPTGAVYGVSQLKAIAELAAEAGIWLLSDEIYEKLVYGETTVVSPVALCEAVREQAAVVNGFSKAYAMTGWRIGYMAAPRPMIAAAAAIQDNSTSGTNSITQKAALFALDLDPAIIEKMRQTFAVRLDKVIAWIRAIPQVTCQRPQGAFYLLPDFSAYLGRVSPQGKRLETCTDLATYLLEEARVALVPGVAFGAPGYLRLSYATDLTRIEQAIAQIKEALLRI